MPCRRRTMYYFIAFLEGIVTFISPCLLPMLPVYVSYFAGDGGGRGTKAAVLNAAGFVAGFTAVFVMMGAFAGAAGSFLSRWQRAVDIFCGAVIIILGLSFTGAVRIGLFKGAAASPRGRGFFPAVLFGAVFSIGWTPCVGAFLGSALMMASQRGSAAAGLVMLLLYSLGLGLPFILSALLIERLKGAFDLIKRNYRVINAVCGAVLIVVGLLMMTGRMGIFLSALTV